MAPPQYVVLSRDSAVGALRSLSLSRDPRAHRVYLAILRGLASSPNGGLSARVPIIDACPDLLTSLHVRTGLVECTRPQRWVAVYQHPVIADLTVTVRSYERPSKRRTFKGSGRRKWLRVKYERTTTEDNTMARKPTRNKKKVDPELEELEALEDLEELEVDEDEVEEKPKRQRRSRRKAQPEPEPDEDDDDDEDDEDDEDEAPAPRKRRSKKAAPAKSKSKASSKSKPTPPVRELPKGKLGVDALSEALGIDARATRVFLRKQDIVEKIDGRWAFTKTEIKQLAKAHKAK